MRLIILAAGLLALSGCSTPSEPAPAPATVAAHACVLPAEIAPLAMVPVDPAQVVRDTPVSYHMLALTWSPEWCRAHGTEPSEKLQCVDNRFGWVLHGLWPNGDRAPHPRFCRAATPVPVATIRRHLCQTPSPDLMQHEWAAHGICAWDDADTYFTQAGALWEGLRRPDPAALAGPSGQVTAGALRTAFVAANPGLTREAVFVGVTSGNRLREVRVCHDLSLKPQACPTDSRGTPDAVAITVQPVS